jgi:predicted acylesterase/phospholipase RssA
MVFEPRFVKAGGITVIQKHDPARRTRASKLALCLSGGAITGGAYKAGGLRALERMFQARRDRGFDVEPFALTDFDVFVGLSAGAILAAALAAGVPAEEIYQVTVGRSGKFEALGPLDFMRPNVGEPFERFRLWSEKVWEVAGNWARRSTNPHTGRPYGMGETLGKLLTILPRLSPTGVFDADGIRRYLVRQMRRSGIPDDFREAYRRTGKELFLTAVDINNGQPMVFGHNERYAAVSISRAVAASCGLPGWYRMVRLPNPRAGEPGERRFLDLADGGLARTANVREALDRGADLIVVYNPFIPIDYKRTDRSLYEHGPYTLVSQMFRTLLGTRLDQAKERHVIDPDMRSDIVYIEPAEDDYDFFLMNPLNFWSRRQAAEHGYARVREALLRNLDVLAPVFANHGIVLSPEALAAGGALQESRIAA